MSEKISVQAFGGIVSAFLAIATFAWGIYTYKETAAAQLAKEKADAERTAQTRRIEATKPFLDKQLALYTQATNLAASIAAHISEPEKHQMLKAKFRELYWGEMGLVEQAEVEHAMVAFNTAMDTVPDKELPKFALALAHACRKELAASWGTNAWAREDSSDAEKQKP